MLKEISDKLEGISDLDWSEIVDKYGIKCHYDVVRKASQTIFGHYFIEKFKLENGCKDENERENIREVLGKQYVTKQQIHNERLKLNKIKRDIVPAITVADEIKEYMAENNFSVVVPEYMYSPTVGESKHTMVCNISDWHIGLLIGNCNGNHYDLDVANDRIRKYIAECEKYIKMYDIKKVYVINTGDTIEHTYMRKTQNQSCEFEQSKQIFYAGELIFQLLVSLARECDVIYGSIAGNHDRMNGDVKANYVGDNANVTITDTLKKYAYLSGSTKISFLKTANDDEIDLTINGLSCKFIHGDKMPKINKDSMAKIISCYNEFYDLLFCGHYHNFNLTSENHGRYIIQTGCLSGYNDYSKSFYCTTNASQTIAILGDGCVELVKDVDLQ